MGGKRKKQARGRDVVGQPATGGGSPPLKGKGKKAKKKREKMPALGEITHIMLSPQAEDAVLHLILQYSGLDAVPHAGKDKSGASGSISGNDEDSSSSSRDGERKSSISSSDDDDSSTSDSDEAIREKKTVRHVSHPSLDSAKRKMMVREVIRDDRRRSRDNEAARAAARTSRRALRTSGMAPAPSAAIRDQLKHSMRVRVRVQCSGHPDTNIVVQRMAEMDSGIDEIRARCRSLFGGSIGASDDSFDLMYVPNIHAYNTYEKSAAMRPLLATDLATAHDGLVVRVIRAIDKNKEVCSNISDVGECESFVPEAESSLLPNMLAAVDIDRDNDAEASVPASRSVYIAEMQRALDHIRSVSSRSPVETARISLPIRAMREEILEAVRGHPVVVVAGETGSGKSTQLPQYIFEDMVTRGCADEANIICTQPRRISAISLADRVNYEMGATCFQRTTLNPCNAEPSSSETDISNITSHSGSFSAAVRRSFQCGFQVRLKTSCTSHTRVVYCTTGILLRKLQDPQALKHISHVILDEVHERQVEMDFLMAILRRRRADFPNLKIILMSATLDEDAFSAYFGCCPVLRVPGRMFPVQLHYNDDADRLIRTRRRLASDTDFDATEIHLDGDDVRGPSRVVTSGRGRSRLGPGPVDADRIVQLICSIVHCYFSPPTTAASSSLSAVAETAPQVSTGDAILVFLPGIEAIREVETQLRRCTRHQLVFGMDLSQLDILILHSSLSPEQQRRVFSCAAPGTWRVVLSTNIAETSVTIEDVTHVIDCGLVKLLAYDTASNSALLLEQPVSLASARQRAGRAGRKRPGHCWRLSEAAFWSASSPTASPIPVLGAHAPALNTSTRSEFFVHAVPRSEGGGQTTVATAMLAAEKTPPEIQRVPLEDVVLKVLRLDGLGDPGVFLASCMDAPSPAAIRLAVSRLVDVGAVEAVAISQDSDEDKELQGGENDEDDDDDLRDEVSAWNKARQGATCELKLTPLGRHIAELPVDLLLGKMLLYAVMLDCVEPVLTIAACLSGKSPFAPALGSKREESYQKHRRFAHLNPFSDHISMVSAFSAWRGVLRRGGPEEARQFCRDHHLSHATLCEVSELRELFRDHLIRAGLVGSGPISSTSPRKEGGEDEADADSLTDDEALFVKYCLCAGLYPNVARLCLQPVQQQQPHGARSRGSAGAQDRRAVVPRLLLLDGTEAAIHPSSLVHRQVKAILNQHTDAYLVYHKKLGTGHLEATMATPPPPHDTAQSVSAQVLTSPYRGGNGSRGMLYDVTVVSAAAVVVFAPSCIVSRNRRRLVVDGWIHFTAAELHAVLLMRLRDMISEYFTHMVADAATASDGAVAIKTGSVSTTAALRGQIAQVLRDLGDPI